MSDCASSPRKKSRSPSPSVNGSRKRKQTASSRSPSPKSRGAKRSPARSPSNTAMNKSNASPSKNGASTKPHDENDPELKKFLEEQKAHSTEANDNFSKQQGSKDHQEPAAGTECLCCMMDIDSSNYVEYQTQRKDSLWYPSKYCEVCLQVLIDSQWSQYNDLLRHATCEAMVRRMLERLPLNVRDRIALPCPDDEEVGQLWFVSDKQVHSAQLKGALVGKEREAFIKDMKDFAEAMRVAKASEKE